MVSIQNEELIFFNVLDQEQAEILEPEPMFLLFFSPLMFSSVQLAA